MPYMVKSVMAIRIPMYTYLHCCTSKNGIQENFLLMEFRKIHVLDPIKLQSWDIIVHHLATSPFKTVHFQTFCKNYCSKTIEAKNMKTEPNESNQFRQ